MALVAATLALLGLPAAAIAHGVLRSSDPASGARLRVAPRQLRLTFNEAVELAVARLELLAPDGRAVALSALRRGDSAAVVVADVAGALAAGTYTVAWQVAGRDGHPVRGRYRFAIDSGAAGLGAPTADSAAHAGHAAMADTAHAVAHDAAPPVPATAAFDAQSPAYAAVRWMGFAAMLALVGAVGFRALVVPAGARRGAPDAWVAAAARGAARLGVAAAALLLLAALLRLGAQSVALHGADGWRDPARLAALVGGTAWGAAWRLQGGAALLALVGLLVARRARAASVGWALAAVGAAGVALASALSGHAAAVSGRAGLAVALDAAHVLGAGGWLGTLLVLVAVGVPAALRLSPDARGAATAAAVEAFSPVALACAALAALTGGVSAWLQLGTPGALWTTAYGRTLLAKLALLSLVVAAGAYNWRRVRPALGDESGARRVRRSATVELAIGAVVLAATAVLVATPPDVLP